MKRRRKSIPKTIRKLVFEKYGGKCGYCGCVLESKQMQIDHISAHSRGGSNDLENLMPSCRMCNYYKGSGSIKSFRDSMSDLHERLNKPFIHRLGAKYGMVNITPFNGKFYFEEYVKE